MADTLFPERTAWPEMDIKKSIQKMERPKLKHFYFYLSIYLSFLSYPILSYPILSLLSYPILSPLILSYPHYELTQNILPCHVGPVHHQL